MTTYAKAELRTVVTWACIAGCPIVGDEHTMSPAAVRARALRHAERTGHTVQVIKATRTNYTPEEEQ